MVRVSRNRRWLSGLATVGFMLLFGLLWAAPEIKDSLDRRFEESVEPGDRCADDKMYMLELINSARMAAGLDPVSLGDNPTAQMHAEALRDTCVLSHWGPDGLKPYARYSMAGGSRPTAKMSPAPLPAIPSTGRRTPGRRSGMPWRV